VKCFTCESDKWHPMPKVNPKRVLQICKTCGTMAMKVEADEEKKMIEYYRKKYRPEPNHTNLLTTTNKLNYIMSFLREVLQKAHNDKKSLICGDIGAATGYLVSKLKQLGHKSTGCELTVTFRRFCEHYYNIPLTEELTPKHKYDLLVIYHVLEHMVEPDKKLIKYRDMLSKDGRIMVATPEWLDVIEEQSGASLKSVANLFHEDHINVFTDKSIKALFAKCGLVIEKEDHLTYGQTYLLKKGTPKKKPKHFYEPWEQVKDKLEKTVKAMQFYFKGKYKKARETWTKFPEAWMSQILRDCGKDPHKQADLWEQCKEVLRNNIRLRISLGHWLYQNQDYESALKVFNEVTVIRPNSMVFIMMGWCYSNLSNHSMAIECYQKSSAMDPTKWAECHNWICREASQMLSWDERALESFTQEVIQKKKPTFELKETFNGKQREEKPAKVAAK